MMTIRSVYYRLRPFSSVRYAFTFTRNCGVLGLTPVSVILGLIYTFNNNKKMFVFLRHCCIVKGTKIKIIDLKIDN